MINTSQEIKIRGYTPKRKGTRNGKAYTYYYVQLVYTDFDGESHTETHSIGKTTSKAAARDEMERLVAEKREELKVFHSMDNDGRIIFLNSFKSWLNSKKGTVEDNTYDGYITRSKAIIRYFEQLTEARGVDAIYLDEVKPKDILAFYKYELEHGRLNPKAGESTGVSRDTVLSYAGLLHNYYRDMVMVENVPFNICNNVAVPRVKVNNVTEKNYMRIDQVKELMAMMDSMDDKRLIPIAKLCLSYGCRRSEVLGIKWNAVDFDNDTLEIKSSAVRGDHTVYYKDNTKSESSHRVYPLTAPIRESLMELSRVQKERGCYRPDGLVFWDTESNKPYSPDYMSKLFKKAVKKCKGIPDSYHFYDMRKTCTTLLLESGDWTLDEIQMWIGHESRANKSHRVLLDHYLTVTMKWKRDKVASIEDIFGGIF